MLLESGQDISTNFQMESLTTFEGVFCLSITISDGEVTESKYLNGTIKSNINKLEIANVWTERWMWTRL